MCLLGEILSFLRAGGVGSESESVRAVQEGGCGVSVIVPMRGTRTREEERRDLRFMSTAIWKVPREERRCFENVESVEDGME